MSLPYIVNHYRVPARKGGTVRYTGDRNRGPLFGEIVGAHGAHLVVRFHGEDMGRRLHPTRELEYLDQGLNSDEKTAGVMRG